MNVINHIIQYSSVSLLHKYRTCKTFDPIDHKNKKFDHIRIKGNVVSN